MKKFVAVLIAFLFGVALFPMNVSASSATQGLQMRDVGDHTITEVEPNYQFSLADRIYNDYTVSGNITSQDLDIFKFTLSTRSYIHIVMVAEYGTVYLALEDSSEDVLAADTTGSYSSGYYGYDISGYLNAGTYYIVILDSATYHSRNIYTMYFTYESTSCSHSSYTSVVSAPSCEEDGYTTYRCNSCNYQWVGSTVPATGHNYEGHVCTVCGAVEDGYAEEDIQSIVVTTLPNKTTYILGREELDVTGGKITVYFENGDSEEMDMDISMVSGFDDSLIGEQEITVTFAGKTCTFEVEVIEDPDAPTITVGSGSVAVGGSVQISVDISNNPGISYLCLTLDYPQDIFEIVSIENGSILSDFTNGLNFIWDSEASSKENGKLMTITLKPIDEPLIGSYDIGLVLREAYDENGLNVDFTMIDGEISIVDVVYGDATGDNVVNGKDVVLMRRYLANYDYDTETSSVEVYAGADANGDGVINGKDLVLARQYMANYNFDTNSSTVVLGPKN